MRKISSIFIVVVILLLPIYGQTDVSNFYSTNISIDNGLSQNHIKAIIQDSYGFMWFGSKNKLNRYDGTAIKTYDCYDKELNKRNNNISSLFEDKNNNLWIGTDKGIFIYSPIYDSFKHFDLISNQQNSIQDWVADIQEDNDDNIWIVVPNQGLFRYNQTTDSLNYYSIGEYDLPDQGNPQCVCIDRGGQVWVGTNGGGIYLYKNREKKFHQYLGNKNSETLEGQNIYTMADAGGYLIVGIHEGKLLKYNKRRDYIEDVDASSVHYKIIRHIEVIDDEIWVGTDNGIYIVNESDGKTTHIQEDIRYLYSISDNQIEKIYQDNEKGIWIATTYGGVSYFPHHSIKFSRHIPINKRNSSFNQRIRELREDKDGIIWIGTENGGISKFNPQTSEFTCLNEVTNNYSLKTRGMLLKDNELWVGYFKGGLDIINLKNQQITHYSGEALGLNESSIYALCEDRHGGIWLGNAWSVFYKENDNMSFKRQNQFGLNYIYDIIEDKDGLIWVATMGNGVYKYNPITDETYHYTNGSDNENKISSNSISSITETSDGCIWFSSDRGGICCYNKEKNKFTNYSIADGLPDDTSYKILEDKNNNLWFGTNMGLVFFNPKNYNVKVFTTFDGLPGNQFNYKSALSSRDGKLYFGGLNGLIEFDPYQISENSHIPPVYITNISIFDEEINVHSKNSPLCKNIIHTKKINLSYKQSNIGFDFVSLSYTAPHANMYAYKMENIDKDWIYTNQNQSVSYAKLPPGKYTFRVKGSNNDGLWNNEDTSLSIVIRPPWWLSSYAYLFYALLFSSIIYYIFYTLHQKSIKKNDEKIRMLEIEKDKELYGAKLDFYTNIAHEIRTPITLINGPLESLMERDFEDEEIKYHLSLMKNNTSQLLGLINQLLDFRKIDSQKTELSFTRVNISKQITSVIEDFKIAIKKQKKTINIDMPKEDIYAYVDRSAFNKILNNLLSNALNYSQATINLQLVSDYNANFTLTISNDGLLIPEEQSDKIFAPFYQVKREEHISSSSGIGLALTRSLVDLHNGELIYSSNNQLNIFTLSMPLMQENIILEEPSHEYILVDEEVKDKGSTQTETILLVEDNIEMLNFLSNRLSTHFKILKAKDGLEAIEVLKKSSIDLVLTDIMMPNMDGFMLCEKIKTNIEYSHIPVILLTAKNDIASKIEGLNRGADAYIEKPFAFEHLVTQLTTIFKNRAREKDAFLRKPSLAIQQMGLSKADQEFLSRATSIIEENIDDPDFNVERFAELVFMSRSSLHRKLKALSNVSPNDFIRIIRLQKARDYIIEGRYRVGEICFFVGINSPSYFIKLFQKQFGMTPKEFELKHRDGAV